MQLWSFLKIVKINATVVAFIPKVEKPQHASQYRPIACCNAIYKCISKVVCNRLREAVYVIVAENQTFFVNGRSLIHYVLICHDLLRPYSRKTTPRCMMKIDLKKVYDMANWNFNFLKEALHGNGFPIPFIKLIMKCVRTTKFTIRINREGYEYFECKRELRQGNPMCPLLFVLVMEYLTRVLKKLGCPNRISISSYVQAKQNSPTWYCWWINTFLQGRDGFYSTNDGSY